MLSMSGLFQVEGHWEVPQGAVTAYSQLMAPNHGRIPIVGYVRGLGDGLEVALRFMIDGQQNLSPFLHRALSTQELADLWERSHHEHHGYDPRGLDPRTGPTRLTVNGPRTGR